MNNPPTLLDFQKLNMKPLELNPEWSKKDEELDWLIDMLVNDIYLKDNLTIKQRTEAINFCLRQRRICEIPLGRSLAKFLLKLNQKRKYQFPDKLINYLYVY